MLTLVNDAQVIKIKVPASAKKIIQDFAQQEDMTEQGLAGRIYLWFAEQPELIQRAILGQIPDEVAPDIARIVLERMLNQRPYTGPKISKRAAKMRPPEG